MGGRVLHDKSGEPGILYVIIITQWIDADTAAVDGKRYEGATAKSGFTGTIKRLNGSTWGVGTFNPW